MVTQLVLSNMVTQTLCWQVVQKLLLLNYQSLDFLQLKHSRLAMMILRLQAAHGIKTVMVLFWVMAQA